MALISSSNFAVSPPCKTYCATKSVARRVASPSGTPNRKKSFAFIGQTSDGTPCRDAVTYALHAMQQANNTARQTSGIGHAIVSQLPPEIAGGNSQSCVAAIRESNHRTSDTGCSSGALRIVVSESLSHHNARPQKVA
jgi:hypothetical protein